MALVSESRDCCSLADPGHVTLVTVQTVDHFFYFFNFWVKIWGKEMMHGKSGNTVNYRGPVNQELTVYTRQ